MPIDNEPSLSITEIMDFLLVDTAFDLGDEGGRLLSREKRQAFVGGGRPPLVPSYGPPYGVQGSQNNLPQYLPYGQWGKGPPNIAMNFIAFIDRWGVHVQEGPKF